MTKNKKNILILESEEKLRQTIKVFLEKYNYQVFSAKCVHKDLILYKNHRMDVIILDGGISELKKVKSIFPFSFVFMINNNIHPQVVVDSIKNGAYDYIGKPFKLETLRDKIDNLLLPFFNLTEKEDFSTDSFIGKSQEITKLKHYIHKIKDYSDTTILIEGDTGTGKGLLSNIIHYNSTRAKQPFVEINCAALPDNLLEAELFGYEQGAFTDAKATKKGLFEIANNGTIFLDEIGDMSLSLQAKFLKVLEDKTIRRLGGVKSIFSNARIIAATNQNLAQKVAEKLFRKDLFFRLNVLSFHIPALKNRGEDIFLLTDFFLSKFNILFNKHITEIVPETRRIFKEYDWPGNVRELSNVLEHIFILEDTTKILPEHLNFYDMLFSEEKKESYFTSFDLKSNEKQLIKQALGATGFNQTQASQLLNISRDNLRYRIKKYNISINKKS